MNAGQTKAQPARPFHAAADFESFRPKLTSLAAKHLNPVLGRRLSPEDVVQETFAAALMREDFFENEPDVPLYFKLRTVLFQTMVDLERRHLAAQKRDAYKELRIVSCEFGVDGTANGNPCIGELPADITSPVSRVDRDERHSILRRALAAMPENDRAILVMRHFDGMGNAECAAALGLTGKAASIRYVRALERLQQKLVEVSCFRKN